jgi:hypothetical protein
MQRVPSYAFSFRHSSICSDLQLRLPKQSPLLRLSTIILCLLLISQVRATYSNHFILLDLVFIVNVLFKDAVNCFDRIWSVRGMILRDEDRSTRKKSTVSLSKTNSTYTGLGSKLGLYVERLARNPQNHCASRANNQAVLTEE